MPWYLKTITKKAWRWPKKPLLPRPPCSLPKQAETTAQQAVTNRLSQMPNLDLEKSRTLQRWVLLIWPAFVAACLLEALVFAAVDPGDVHWPGFALQPSRQATYSAAFFCFWLVGVACSSVVLRLSKPPRDINDTARS